MRQKSWNLRVNFMITKEEVQRIAKLARLGLADHEIENLQKDLSSILNYIEKLKQADVFGAEPISHSLKVENVMRGGEDLMNEKVKDKAEKLLELMPEVKDRFLKVKSILNGSD